MATNFDSEGRYLTVIAPAGGLTSGQGFVIANLFLVSQGVYAAAAVDAVGDTQGVYKLPGNSSDTFAAGEPVFWDISAEECVDTAIAGDQQIGVALGAADGDDIVRVRLDGIGQDVAT